MLGKKQGISKHNELDKSKLVKTRNKQSQIQNNMSNEQKLISHGKNTLSVTLWWANVLCVLIYSVGDWGQVVTVTIRALVSAGYPGYAVAMFVGPKVAR